MSAEPVTVEQPKHALHALTTFELRNYRRELRAPSRSSTGRTPCRQPGVTCKPGLMKC